MRLSSACPRASRGTDRSGRPDIGAIDFSLSRGLVDALRSALAFEVFVETGTFEGDTVEAMRDRFGEIHSVELSERHSREAAARFAGSPHVHIAHGNSPDFLRGLREHLAGRSVLYFFDAHWCVAGDVAGEKSQCPLLEEIAAVAPLEPGSAILVDDARLFLAPPLHPHEASQWPSFDEVDRALRATSPVHELLVVNDVIVFLPPQARVAAREFAARGGTDWLVTVQAAREVAQAAASRDEAYRTAREAAAELERVAGQLREAVAELDRKEAVIDELHGAVRSFRRAPLSVFGRRMPFLDWPMRAVARYVTPSLVPRLGVLHQHPPRPLRLPAAPTTTGVALPAISLVTPSFRQATYIERTIESVLAQGYPGLEYFVQDGGSEDGTVAILETHEGRITGWESRPDRGQSEAINRAFARTRGEIMGWINSDDILLPGALACVGEYFARHPGVDAVYGHRILIDEEDREIGRWMLPAHDDAVLSWADFVPQETLFWRRSLWEKAGGRVDESFRFAMDWDLLVRFREAGARFARIPRFLGGFRVHPQQKTSAGISEIGFREMDRIRERVLGRVPTRVEVRKAVAPYLMRHVIVDLGWRIRNTLGLQA